ncbi:hypothetical protein ACMZOO_06470 [Catenovulum sp. SX2]|uniref:hypothetical protein n=1 Tax=Catenovulum sp. SX2 TaxID=3398614 RepID=UPI003F844862
MKMPALSPEDRLNLMLKTIETTVRDSKLLHLDDYHQIKHSVGNNTIYYFENNLLREDGYICWANISKESYTRLVEFGLPPQSPYEYHEGRILFIGQVYSFSKHIGNMKRAIRAVVKGKRLVAFKKDNVVKCYVRKKGKLTLINRVEFKDNRH